MTYKPAVIPVPSWALEDDELIALHDKLQEVEAEVSGSDDRSPACVAAIRIELQKRGRPINLTNIQE